MTPTTKTIWQQTIQDIAENGNTYIDGDKRKCIEVQNKTMTIPNPQDASISEPYTLLRSHDEWVYPTKQQLLDVIFDKEQINSLDYTYGSRLLNFDNAINQIKDYIIPLLKDNPQSRRAIAQFYDPRLDSTQQRTSTPGIIYLHFLKRNDALHCSAMIRSNDVFFGYPANILQIHYVHRWVADQLNTKQGKITTVSNSAHIFHDARQDIKAILNIDITGS